MTDQSASVDAVVRHFKTVYVEKMQDLPIVNPKLSVEAVGFRDFEGHRLGVLVTPWFMNLVVLPDDDTWAPAAQGDTTNIEFPSGRIEFTVSQTEGVGAHLTAVLFRSVLDMPDQTVARDIATQVMQDLFKTTRKEPALSRREFFAGRRTT